MKAMVWDRPEHERMYYCTTREFANALDVSPQTILAITHKHSIPHYHYNMIVGKGQNKINLYSIDCANTVIERIRNGEIKLPAREMVKKDWISPPPPKEPTELEKTIASYIVHRQKKGRPLTKEGVSLLYEELDKLASDDETKIAILKKSIFNGWTGIFPLSGSHRSQLHLPPAGAIAEMLKQAEQIEAAVLVVSDFASQIKTFSGYMNQIKQFFTNIDS
jgi:hypothetical protein